MAELAQSKSDGRARPPGAPQTEGQNASDTQECLISFLESPASYPNGPSKVRVIQTHISWVFIASPFVFKVKKPVNLGFLDFSTLEKRRYFCQREVDLNRRLAPDVYLGVAPIYKTASGFSFEADGEIAEYAVKMRELPYDWFLNELLERDLVGQREIERVISRLHRFYECETPTPRIEQWGAPEKLKISTDENFAQTEPFISKTISPAAFEAIRHYTNEFLVTNGNLFRKRIQRHRIRDCHGDLHLDHIHITPEHLSIFDCIEFNDRFRFIDIANDLAFLAMDFDFEGRSDLANLVLQTAASEFQDDGLLKITDFYKCYRAFVRGKVESIQSAELVGTARRAVRSTQHVDRTEEYEKLAARYFRLALRYAVAGSEPLMLVIMGHVGTGKTTVARELGHELDWPVFSSDEIRKALVGVPLAQRTPQDLREKVYSPQMTQRTYRKMVEHGLDALKKYAGVILDATFATRALRRFLGDECKRAKIRIQVVEINADPATIQSRLKARDHSAGEISDARLEDLQKLSATYEQPSELAADLIRISANGSVAETVEKLLLQRAEKQGRALSQAPSAV